MIHLVLATNVPTVTIVSLSKIKNTKVLKGKISLRLNMTMYWLWKWRVKKYRYILKNT